MGLELTYIAGQTPLSEDDKEGLVIPTISTRTELDEFEQLNIEHAVQWSMSRKFKQQEILSEFFIKQVHKKMFGNVWRWAGKFRTTNTNIGVDKWQIAFELRNLLHDTHYWIEYQSYSPDEIAVRFKHRLVSIHCFPNGNGRHSRLMADILIEKIFNKPLFSWGNSYLVDEGGERTAYLKAIRAADAGNYLPLITFARSVSL